MLFNHIDWQMIFGYFKSYLICLISLLTLYIVVDMFTNLDDFLHQNTGGLKVVLYRVGYYYLYRLPQLFDRLCEAVVLLAGMFTVALMQRNNEQLPLLSAGVSTQRVDHRLSDRTLMFGRWTATRWKMDSVATGLPLSQEWNRSQRNLDAVTVAVTHSFSPVLLYEFRLGVSSDYSFGWGLIDGPAAAGPGSTS